MSRKERWLTSVAFIISVVPLLFMAYTLKLLPVKLPIVNIGIPDSEPEVISKYNNLIMGLFCIVPLSIVIIARYLKRKLVYYKNYPAIICVSIMLSLAFTGIVLYGFIIQADNVRIDKFDICSLISIVLSLFIAMLGTFIRYRKFGTKIAVNNRFTRVSAPVWRAVHHSVALVQTISFVAVSIIVSFLTGYVTLIIFAAALAAFGAWVMFHSYAVKIAFDRRHASAVVPVHKDL